MGFNYYKLINFYQTVDFFDSTITAIKYRYKRVFIFLYGNIASIYNLNLELYVEPTIRVSVLMYLNMHRTFVLNHKKYKTYGR